MNLDWEILFFILFILPVFGYAEIHYRFSGFPSLLHKKEPEILFDLPHRILWGQPVPLFLMLKDSHLYPVKLFQAEIEISPVHRRTTKQFKEFLNQDINQKFYRRTIPLSSELFPEPGIYEITAKLNYQNSLRQQKELIQDNYAAIPHPPFIIRVSKDPLPCDSNWHWGDLHVHTLYTRDQVEFGASLEDTVIAAQACGLDFLAVTDHSYDLDDETDDYLQNDIHLAKWKKLWEEVADLQKKYPDFVLIAGEEVSAGNQRDQNVHCLILNDPEFYPGSGDSAEKLLHRKPELSVEQLLSKRSENSIAIAAHPREKPPLSQKIILNRGVWNWNDLANPRLNSIQLMNTLNDSCFMETRDLWIQLLLNGFRTGIVAGNDSHGNFNCFRQISIPFLKMTYSRNHLLGQARTAVFAPSNQLEDLIESIRSNRTLVSTGPIATIELKGSQKGIIGDSLRYEEGLLLSIRAESTPEFGPLNQIAVYYGHIRQKTEIREPVSIKNASFKYSGELPFPHPKADYVRIEARSSMDDQNYYCLSSPIWFIREYD